MNHQGAHFAFDTSMDFANMFTAPQQTFKPVEDDTPGFLFADEGIDTTTSSFIDPTLFDTPQQSTFDMQQSLTMDNTSMSTLPWDLQLDPHMQIPINTFSHTPVQSFDTTLIPDLTNSLGKRPLQLEAHDIPSAKRHEAPSDFTLFPSFPSTTSASSWDQTSPPATVETGLSDEAADVCATWFNKYNILPGDRHIEALSQLTGESAGAVRSWFGQLLKQGMGGNLSDSAYKSQTTLAQQNEPFWHDQTYSTELAQAASIQLPTPEVTSTQEANATVVQPASSLRGSKKRCTPTEDLDLLSRDPAKIYQCTRKCGKRYGRKNDWKRNEEEGYPCRSWVCSLCTSRGVEGVKPCYRKYHFVQHFRNIHPEMNADDYAEGSMVHSETEFPRKCGFCRHRFQSRQERIDHIADHFKQGKCMLDWRDEDVDSHDSDTGDDDDDRPNGDDSDQRSSYPPPQFDQQGGSDSKSSGSGSGSGSTDPAPSGGFFQFQLSQLGESQLYCAAQPTKPITPLPNICQSSTLHESDLGQHLLPERHISATEDDESTLARNVLAQSLVSASQVASLDDTTEDRVQDRQALQRTRSKLEADDTCSTVASCLSLTSKRQTLDIRRPGTLSSRTATIPAESSATAPQTRPERHLQHVPKSSHPFFSVKLLGLGGFSTVDEAVHRQTGLHVARKTLKNREATAIEELRKEVGVLQKLRHPHVIRFLGAYSKGNKMSILLSPVAETTLALWLERAAVERPANLVKTITGMFGCLASSVEYLHAQQPVVIHMDIKPQNILIVQSGHQPPHVVLSDFGISSADEASSSPPTSKSQPLTRQYIAPEVLEGLSRKQAADIWSLGCVYAEMAAVPFAQTNTAWHAFRTDFNSRKGGKYYWQDVPGIQSRLSSFAANASSAIEGCVVKTLQAMLNADPLKRPSAAELTLIFTPATCCSRWSNDDEVAVLDQPGRLLMQGCDAHHHHHEDSLGGALSSSSSSTCPHETCLAGNANANGNAMT